MSVETDCLMCEEPFQIGDPLVPVGTLTEAAGFVARMAHVECMMRTVLGGIGHLENHAYWCGIKEDCDAGLTFRESALKVKAWVDEHGIEAAIKAGSEGEAAAN